MTDKLSCQYTAVARFVHLWCLLSRDWHLLRFLHRALLTRMSLKQPPPYTQPHHWCKNLPQEPNLDNSFPITKTAIFVRPQTRHKPKGTGLGITFWFLLDAIWSMLRESTSVSFCPEIRNRLLWRRVKSNRDDCQISTFSLLREPIARPPSRNRRCLWFSICERLWLLYLFWDGVEARMEELGNCEREERFC